MSGSSGVPTRGTGRGFYVGGVASTGLESGLPKRNKGDEDPLFFVFQSLSMLRPYTHRETPTVLVRTVFGSTTVGLKTGGTVDTSTVGLPPPRPSLRGKKKSTPEGTKAPTIRPGGIKE